MKIKLYRHATLEINIKGITFLVDPMLCQQGAMSAVEHSPRPRPNPLSPLPGLPNIAEIDAVLLTHLHRDHLDEAAIRLLPKNLPVFCQAGDEVKLQDYGFLAVHPVEKDIVWREITITRTGGRHGIGEIGQQMGKVSGYVIHAAREPKLYIAGDTIWCEEVQEALARYQPACTIVFAGAAQFLTGSPITMTAEDVKKVCSAKPDMRIIAVHMEAFNHCLLSRQELRSYAEQHGFSGRLYIPADGEIIGEDVL